MEKKTIHETMAAVYADVGGGIAKDKKLTGGGNYSYLSDDKLTAIAHDAMAKHGVVMVPEGIEVLGVREGQTRSGGAMTFTTHTRITWRFYGPAGDSIVCQSLGEGQDMGDKSFNKSMTAARKYALRLALLIGTGEDPDDKASEEHTPRQRPAQQLAAPAPAPTLVPAPAPSAPDMTGVMSLYKTLQDEFGWTPEQKRAFPASVGLPPTPKEWTQGQVELLTAALNRAIANLRASITTNDPDTGDIVDPFATEEE